MTESTRRRRRRGDGSTYQTADGRWRAAITTPDPATGRHRRQYLSAPTERELLAKLKEARGARERGETTGRTPTVTAWSAQWLVTKRLQVRPASWIAYRNALRHLEPALGSTELARITVADVESALAGLVAGGLAPSTVALTRVGLGACLADAVRDGIISRNVAHLARAPRVPAMNRRVLASADLRRLFEAVADESIGPATVLLGTTALRRSELLGLRWEDLDRTSRMLSVRRQVARNAVGYAEPKTARSYRTVGLPTRAIAALDELAGGPTWPPEGPVVTLGGRAWHPVAFAKAFRAAADRFGFTGLRMHDLRHGAVSLALAAGVPPRDVAEMAGHSPAMLMSVYAHVLPGARERVTAALDGALGDD